MATPAGVWKLLVPEPALPNTAWFCHGPATQARLQHRWPGAQAGLQLAGVGPEAAQAPGVAPCFISAFRFFLLA